MKVKVVVGVVILSFLLTGCGYHFRGSGAFPKGVKTVHIKQFENRTSEAGIESQFTNDLVNEFILNRKGALVPQKAADAVINGVIRTIRTESIARSGNLQSQQRRVIITVDVTLRNQRGQRIWFAGGISDNQEYDTGADRQATDVNKRQAIKLLSEKMAQKIYDRLTEDF